MGLFRSSNRSRPESTDPSFNDKASINGSIKTTNTSKSKAKSVRQVSSTADFHASLPDIMADMVLDGPPSKEQDGGVAWLKSIYSVREQCKKVLELAKKDDGKGSNHFEIDMGKFEDTAGYVVSIIKRDFAGHYNTIPPHGRWQHFDVGGRPRIEQLMSSWPSNVGSLERCRRLIDLFVVSVLLDAGAGTKWQYKSKESGKIYKRSEGLAVASLEMFKAGLFSSNADNVFQVDCQGLSKLTVETVGKALQVSESNPITGLEGRTNLLIRLSQALNNDEIFGEEGRPGGMLNYLLSHESTRKSDGTIIAVPTLWSVLMDGLGPIWPETRTKLNGKALGDAWHCNLLKFSTQQQQPYNEIVPFHKLTQWMCYSLMVPITKILNVHFAGQELMTGLAEYRNGGLLVDTGLLTLKPEDTKRGIEFFHQNAAKEGQQSIEVVPLFTPDDDVIVEWRALTVALLDELLVAVNSGLGLVDGHKLSLAQMLEAGTWKGGREIAEVSRPNTKEPPIMILSDGTVF